MSTISKEEYIKLKQKLLSTPSVVEVMDHLGLSEANAEKLIAKIELEDACMEQTLLDYEANERSRE